MQVYCRPIPPAPLAGVTVSIQYQFPDRRRRDPDNYSGKMLLDGLVHAGILQDDSFGCIQLELSASNAKEPSTMIKIKKIGGLK